MKLGNSLRMLWLGIWMIVTGLLLAVTGTMAALSNARETPDDSSDTTQNH